MPNQRMIRERCRGLEIAFEIQRVIAEVSTEHQDIVVADTAAYGRALFLDGNIQSAQSDEALYHEALVHPALVMHGTPRDVLVAGAGEGACVREILRHRGVERVTMVDLDPSVVDVARAHLPTWHQGAFDDPRVDLRFADIRDALAQTEDDAVDAVIVDLTEPLPDGPSAGVLTRAFFDALARILRPGGVVAVQAGELDLVEPRPVRTLWQTMRGCFSAVQLAHAYVPSFHGLWGFLLASNAPMQIEPARLAERVASLRGCRVYDEVRHRAWLRPPALFRCFEPESSVS